MNVKYTRKVHVLVAFKAGEIGREVQSTLEDGKRFFVTSVQLDKMKSLNDDLQFDVAIVALERFSSDEVDSFNTLKARFPNVPVVAAFGKEPLSEDSLRQLFRLGVQDWQHSPFEKGALQNSVQSVVRGSQTSHNKVHAVISAVGGAGATTVAITMADLLAARAKKTSESVALFDLDFSSGDCSYELNLMNSFDLRSVISNPERIDPEFIRQIQKSHRNNFAVYSFKMLDLNTDLNGYELVLRMLDAVSIEHDHAILDIPYYETDWKMDVLSAVNSYTIVTARTVPAIKQTVDLIDRLKATCGDKIEVSVIFNKHESRLFGQRLRNSAIKTLLGDIPKYVLPREDSVILEAADRGKLPREISGRSAFVRKVRKYIAANKNFAGGGV